jgi:DNA polymerase III alpha subunit (gram-positive type)
MECTLSKYCPVCGKVIAHYGPPQARCLCGWFGQVYELRKEPMLAPVKLKFVSIDIETTGLNPDTCQVLEIGAVIEDWVSPVDKLPTFHKIIRRDLLVGEPFALALNCKLLRQLSVKDLPDTCLPEEAGRRFAEWLRLYGVDPKHVQPAGKNFASFDEQFLNRLPLFSDFVHFKHRTIDPTMLFWQSDDEGLPDSQTCMKRSGIDGKVAHTAVEDALAVVKMVRYYWSQR